MYRTVPYSMEKNDDDDDGKASEERTTRDFK